MNKNTTDITLSAYFNDIVIGYYEDEDLVKQFGRQLGFDVDMDTFMAVSFQYPSDMNVKPEDREKLTDAANAIIALSDINKKIGGKQIITCDSGDCVILIMKDKSAMRDLIPQIKETALQEVEKISADRKIRVGIGTIENGIKGIKHTYSNAQDAVKAGEDRQELHERIRELSMEAGRNVKVEGKENNLLELIAADPAFPMGLEELKASMDPSKYIGRSKEQVEAFLKNVISPILEANKDLLGVKAEINV